jgi:hypothetical protein
MLPLVPAPASPSPEAPAIINIIFVYDKISAALQATETLDSFRRQIPDGADPRLSPWSFSTLENPTYRAEAMAMAAQADLIVVAISNRIRRLPVSVENWLRASLTGRHSAKTTVAAVFGDADLPDGPDSPRLQTVQRLALEGGCEFIAPGVTETVLSAIA